MATPTHTETIIVTPPKNDHGDHGSRVLKPPIPTSSLMPPSVTDHLCPGQPSFSESFAVDPNEILLKNKPIKQDPDVLPSYQEANFNLSKFKLCNLPPISPIDTVQLTAQALLMNVKPDPNFDPNLRIKKECPDYPNMSASSRASVISQVRDENRIFGK